ncbi:MAG: phosphoribosylglycinamide formyltransferase [Bdellovibrionales bacterium]|nr:phosphoribosylglycinamide formyltransferase [Bdellovibrionales bacterium]
MNSVSGIQKQVVVFASGEGTLFEEISSSNKQSEHGYQVVLLVTNNENCGAAQKARSLGIRVMLSKEFTESEEYNHCFVVLAGFLRLIPQGVLDRYPRRMINSHPSLLPKYGGKGMYGMHVHNAVVRAGEKESGFTIHYVSKDYDEGEIIYQGRVTVEQDETAESLAEKVKSYERDKLPEIIGQLVGNS